MGIIKKDFRYKIVKNFISVYEKNLLHHYTRIKHRTNDKFFDGSLSNHPDTSIYADPVMESLLLNKLKFMENNTGLELLPTYAYWRMYTWGACLKKHKDRPSCEISVTLSLGSSDDKPWPIYINDKPAILEHGDAVIYLGVEDTHHRNMLDSDYHSQVFLHYVDKNGPYKKYHKDGRLIYGVNKEGRAVT
jgi:hypothetical protein